MDPANYYLQATNRSLAPQIAAHQEFVRSVSSAVAAAGALIALPQSRYRSAVQSLSVSVPMPRFPTAQSLGIPVAVVSPGLNELMQSYSAKVIAPQFKALQKTVNASFSASGYFAFGERLRRALETIDVADAEVAVSDPQEAIVVVTALLVVLAYAHSSITVTGVIDAIWKSVALVASGLGEVEANHTAAGLILLAGIANYVRRLPPHGDS